MNPKQVLAFVLSVLASLALLMIVFPKNGIPVTDNFALEFVTLNEMLSDENNNLVDINTLVDTTTDINENAEFTEHRLDSAYIDSVLVFYKPVPISIDSVRQYLEYPVNNAKVLEPLFAYMANLGASNDLMRILHYGDSQIETDRITSYLRYKLQSKFGGSGAGLLPAKQPFETQTPMQVIPSDKWYRYTLFPAKDTLVKHNRYGVLGSFCTFIKITAPDSSKTDSSYQFVAKALTPKKDEITARISFKQSQYSSANVKIYNTVKMIYGYNTTSVKVNIFDGESLILTDSVKPTNYTSIKSFNFATTPKDLHFELSGNSSPEIYGFAFDAGRGIAVDNIPMRGSAGTTFTATDLTQLKQLYSLLNVKLLILQFGGNVIPYMTDEKVDSYKRMFSAQLRALKRINPEMAIIVIGPADMSTKVKDSYETYPVLEKVIEALKVASFENGAAFWNMYLAMGGKNSMPSWVFAEKPLAEKDFVHFTPQGSNVIAKMFFNAFINEYNNYLYKQNKTPVK